MFFSCARSRRTPEGRGGDSAGADRWTSSCGSLVSAPPRRGRWRATRGATERPRRGRRWIASPRRTPPASPRHSALPPSRPSAGDVRRSGGWSMRRSPSTGTAIETPEWYSAATLCCGARFGMSPRVGTPWRASTCLGPSPTQSSPTATTRTHSGLRSRGQYPAPQPRTATLAWYWTGPDLWTHSTGHGA